MLDAKPKEISEIQRLNYEQVIETIFIIIKYVIFNVRMYSLVSISGQSVLYEYTCICYIKWNIDIILQAYVDDNLFFLQNWLSSDFCYWFIFHHLKKTLYFMIKLYRRKLNKWCLGYVIRIIRTLLFHIFNMSIFLSLFFTLFCNIGVVTRFKIIGTGRKQAELPFLQYSSFVWQ